MRPISRFRIDANGPFDQEAALGTLAAHAVEGLHQIAPDSPQLTRWIDVHGDPQPVTVSLDAGGATVTTATRDQGVNAEIDARVRHWFDLDTDLTPMNALLGSDPVFAEQVQSRPGIRITRFHSPFEAVILTVLGQRVSLATGRLFAARLVAAYGSATAGGGEAAGLGMFPAPSRLAAVPVEDLRAAIGLTGSRVRAVHEVAVLFAETDHDETLPEGSTLHAVHGIGPWTLNYLAIRASTDTDAFPATDAVLRRGLAAITSDTGAARIASWSPYRSYAASRLWARTL